LQLKLCADTAGKRADHPPHTLRVTIHAVRSMDVYVRDSLYVVSDVL